MLRTKKVSELLPGDFVDMEPHADLSQSAASIFKYGIVEDLWRESPISTIVLFSNMVSHPFHPDTEVKVSNIEDKAQG